MKKRILAALLVFVALLTGCSRKETTGQWPSQKIEIDVCYTAGGTADTVARQLSALMSQQLSTTFNLVNVTGGSGSIAGQQVYAAAHDGYTWLGDVAHTVSGWRTLGYADLGWEDFYGFYAASSPYVLFVSGNSPYQTAQQLFDAMRGDPSMKWGNAGLGSINQLTGSLMLEKLGLKGNSVPYDGGRSAAIKVVSRGSDLVLVRFVRYSGSGTERRYPHSGHLRQQPPGDRLCKGELYRTQPSGRLPRVERSSGIAVLGLPGFPRYTGRRRGKDPRRIPEYCGQQRVGAVLPDQRAGACGNNRHRERRNMCKAGIHLCMGSV